MSRIAIIIGHPRVGTFCEALGMAYAYGARQAGHSVDVLHLSRLEFDPILREAYARVQPREPDLDAAFKVIMAADHLVFVFPLWLGDMPALLKGFLERVFQPELVEPAKQGKFVKFLKGKSARLVVTMGMPSVAYWLWFGPHALRLFTGNLLSFVGARPVRWTVYGSVGAAGQSKRENWLKKLEAMGATCS